MISINNFYFLDGVTSTTESPITYNSQGETLTIQVDGTGSGVSLEVMGCSDLVSDSYYALTGFTTSFSKIQTILQNGIYTFGIDGISKIKIKLNSISSGNVTVFGKITKGV